MAVFIIKYKYSLILHRWYRGCWCPGYARCRNIDAVNSEYSAIFTVRVHFPYNLIDSLQSDTIHQDYAVQNDGLLCWLTVWDFQRGVDINLLPEWSIWISTQTHTYYIGVFRRIFCKYLLWVMCISTFKFIKLWYLRHVFVFLRTHNNFSCEQLLQYFFFKLHTRFSNLYYGICLNHALIRRDGLQIWDH